MRTDDEAAKLIGARLGGRALEDWEVAVLARGQAAIGCISALAHWGCWR